MKNIYIIILVIGLSVTGCSTLDNWVFDVEEVTETQIVEKEYTVVGVDQDGNSITNIVTKTEPIEVIYEKRTPTQEIATLKNIGGAIGGPWVTFGLSILSGILGIWGKNRNRIAKSEALKAEDALSQKSKIEKAAKVLTVNIKDLVDLLDDGIDAPKGSKAEKILRDIAKTQEDWGVRDIIDIILKSKALK